MKVLKVYVAGKVSPNSVFKTPYWREDFCKDLEKRSGMKIVNLDPIQYAEDFDANQNDPELIYGRNCFMIKSADLVIVNLTDDISVGGSQEMLIAKHFKKPLIGIIPFGGKFNKSEKEARGRIYKNWKEPFVLVPCDAVVENIDEAASWIKKEFPKLKRSKGLERIDKSVQYYLEKFYDKDQYVKKNVTKK